jgi:hypothetical protein
MLTLDVVDELEDGRNKLAIRWRKCSWTSRKKRNVMRRRRCQAVWTLAMRKDEWGTSN